MAGMLLDNLPIATDGLNTLINYSFDEMVALPQTGSHKSEIEVSPFTFEEKLNIADNATGDNLGATHDDMNISIGTGALKLRR